MQPQEIIGFCVILLITGFAFTAGILAIFHVAKTSDQWQETQLPHEYEEEEPHEFVFYVDEYGALQETYAHQL